MAVSYVPAGPKTASLTITPGELSAAVVQALPFLRRSIDARGDAVTDLHGGDPVSWRSPRNVQRHVANYLAATRLGGAADAGRYLDVGCGVGALAAWSAYRLEAQAELVDADPTMRALASFAFAGARVTAAIADAGEADLVTAMEVVEHVPPSGQHAFVASLFTRVSPGGCLVISTPDESSYPFGSSGYRPHVGCLDGRGLRKLLQEATGQPAEVWRLDGGPFTANRGRMWGEWVANHLWAMATPGPIELIGKHLIRRTRKAPSGSDLTRGVQRVTLQAETSRPTGTGTGLIARVVRPD